MVAVTRIGGGDAVHVTKTRRKREIEEDEQVMMKEGKEQVEEEERLDEDDEKEEHEEEVAMGVGESYEELWKVCCGLRVPACKEGRVQDSRLHATQATILHQIMKAITCGMRAFLFRKSVTTRERDADTCCSTANSDNTRPTSITLDPT